MNTMRSTLTFVIAGVVIFGLASCSSDDTGSGSSYGDTSVLAQAQEPSCLCGPTQARNMGQLLLQSNPLVEADGQRWNNYVQWINNNANLLTQDGPTMVCARKLGNAFTSYGLRNFNQADYNDSYGRVLEMGGNIDQAQGVADSMMSGALDAYMTGQELLWLARVIPSAAVGNWNPFLTTGTQSRLQFRQVIPIIQQAGLSYDLGQLAPFIDQFGPMVEEQMVMAACLYTG